MEDKLYTVELTGMAFMRQRRQVRAACGVDALQKALEDYNDHIWDYQGMDDHSIEAEINRVSPAVGFETSES